ncbi:DNA cytosine methyltransferase [Eggerthellaceae bacterium zg-1084]|nr:DNA cytosine methyltransferase [Berryella wangjianweii]
MEYISMRACAQMLGVTPQTVARLTNSGQLTSDRIDSRRVFSHEAIWQYLERENLTPAPIDHQRLNDELPAITAISFFSGALGLDLGFEQAGIKALLYCENDLKCRMTINANRPDAALVGDIATLTKQDVLERARIPEKRGVDIMFGGPPCQAFSTAGARRAFADVRGNAFLCYLELAKQIKPRYLVIENVRGLLSTPYPLRKNGEPVRQGALTVILKKLTAMGYRTSFNLYNAANFGAPQLRDRIVMVAKREGQLAPWLTPTHSCDASWGLPKWRTLKDACAHLQTQPQHHTQFPEKRLRYFRMLKEGQYWRDLPTSLQAEAMGKAHALSGGKTGFYRRLSWDKPSPTLVTSPTMPATDLCHPTLNRPLSVEEYAAIQGFPSDWRFCGDITNAYRQIGNAVPIDLGRAIALSIVNDMEGRRPDPRFEQFPYSRYRHTNQNNWNKA